jgi:DNA-binding transcriptional ArsR family regulator
MRGNSFFVCLYVKILPDLPSMIRLLTHSEQLAAHLREEILRGRWQGEMPGAARLQAKLGVNQTTINQALGLLEEEGLLVSRGNRRRRQIIIPHGVMRAGMRVGILLYEPEDREVPLWIEVRHRLMDEGVTVFIPPKTLSCMGMDVAKVAKLVEAAEADAWIVLCAPGKVLEWFEKQATPAIAFAGQYPRGMKMAAVAPGRDQSMLDLIERLAGLGHRRIVLLTGSGAKPISFIRGLEDHGIPVGDYNLPSLERSPDGLRRCLDSLFGMTPPTALLIDESAIFLAVQGELARRGIFAPKDISLVSLDGDPAFKWHRPPVAQIRWEMEPVIRHIFRWVMNVSIRKVDRRSVYTKSVFIDGGTIGPAKEYR